MEERFTEQNGGIRQVPPLPSSVERMGIQSLTEPAPFAVTLPSREQNRELVWFVLWASWGAISRMIIEWDGDTRKVIIPTIAGGLIGIVGGCIGERFVGKRVGSVLVLFWVAYWAVLWSVILLAPILGVSAIMWLHGEKVEGLHRAIILGVLLGVGIGATGGAIGGMIRSRMKRNTSPSDTTKASS